MSEPKTVTDLIASAMDIQEKRRPDSDPGDVTIEIQDDMSLVTIFQRNWIRGFGDSVETAAQSFYDWVERGEPN